MAFAESLSKVDQLKGEIDKLRPINPEQERQILNKFRLDWNYHSNAIEGNRLTLGETRAFLMEGLTAQGKPFKDHLDIKGHDEAIRFLEGFVRRSEMLSEATIRELHKMVLREPYEMEARTPTGQVTKKWVKLGQYKTEPNFIQSGTGEVRNVVLPEDTPAQMHDLLEWFRKETLEKSAHPILIAAIFHHRFTHIHPFDDGNGRLARILMNLILMQNGLPPVIIKADRKDQYISALIKADAGEETDLLTLIADYEIYSQELLLRGARGEDITDFDDVDKRIALLKQQLKHIEEPAEFSFPVLKLFSGRCIEPILNKLVTKGAQLDDLYASNWLNLSGQYSVLGAKSGTAGWQQTLHGADKATAVDQLHQCFAQSYVFKSIQAQFTWEGFKKARFNTFSDHLTLNFGFQKFQYDARATGYNGQIVFEHKNIYQLPLDAEQIARLVAACLDFSVKHIEEELKRGLHL
jgi:Fic family protein